jgi:hypothetical protein
MSKAPIYLLLEHPRVRRPTFRHRAGYSTPTGPIGLTRVRSGL